MTEKEFEVIILLDSKDEYKKVTDIVGHNPISGYRAVIGYYVQFKVNREQIKKLKNNCIPFSLVEE